MRLSIVKAVILIIGSIVSVFINAGCSTNRSMYGGADKPALLSAKRTTSFDYTHPSSADYYLTAYRKAEASKDNTEMKSVRNQILNDLMLTIDSNYYDFENNLRGDKGMQELGADLASLGLTAASTVVGAAETKTILSAIATGVIGVNASIDKEVYQNNTVQALQLQMRAQRALVEQDLISGMKKEIVDYPLENGIRNIVAYYNAGSLTDALIGLVQTSGVAAKDNQDGVQKVLNAPANGAVK